MCGLEQQHHFLWLMSLTSHQFPEQEVYAKVETQIRSQTHPAVGEREFTGKLASKLHCGALLTEALYFPVTSGPHVHASSS